MLCFATVQAYFPIKFSESQTGTDPERKYPAGVKKKNGLNEINSETI